MVFFLVAALLTAIAVAAIVLPLWRSDDQAPTVNSEQVYRDQLQQVDKDAANGLISKAEAVDARAEIGRRLIAAADEAQARPGAQSRQHPILALVLAMGVPILVGGVYLSIGSPGTPDAPLAGRDIPETARNAQTANQSMPNQQMPELIDQLKVKLAENPDDEEGWALLARSYFSQEMLEEAVGAYEKAVEINGRTDTALLGEYGEVLIVARGGMVVPDALAAFVDVLKREPGDPRAAFFVALAKAQAGNIDAAMREWATLLNNAPPDAPWRGAVQTRIEGMAREAGIDLADYNIAAVDAPRGPTQEQMAAAGEMEAGDRQAMIGNMVAGLRERLETEEPDNLDGWKRLARAYGVMGRAADELYALDKAAALAPDDGELKARIDALSADGTVAAPRGPSPEQVEQAAQETPEDRQAMIASMVAGLRERLETDEPENLDGWMQLARSYNVLDQTDNELFALRKAAALAPGNPSVELPIAEILMEQSGGEITPEVTAGLTRALKFDPKSQSALWHLGRGAVAAGNLDQASDYWTRLLATLEPGTPDHDGVNSALESLTQ